MKEADRERQIPYNFPYVEYKKNSNNKQTKMQTNKQTLTYREQTTREEVWGKGLKQMKGIKRCKLPVIK